MELNFTGTDVCAINGTRSAPEAKYDLVVIGAGPSGIAAAIEGAASGASVLLVDENPVSGALMGNDTPLYFGGRMTAATQNSDRMLEAIFMSMPDLEKAMETGVELLLGTTAWGVYRNGPGVQRQNGLGWSALTGLCSPRARAILPLPFRAGTSRV